MRVAKASPSKRKAKPKSQATRMNRTMSFGYRVDRDDARDMLYGASGDPIPKEVDNRGQVNRVLDQRPEGACTGMAVCAAAELLHRRATGNSVQLSSRWAYRRAREEDALPGENYEGCTPRAALEAWHKQGICEESFWDFAPYPKRPGDPGFDLISWEKAPLAGAAANALKYRLLDFRRCNSMSELKLSIHTNGVAVVGGETHSGWDLWDGNDTIPYVAGVQPRDLHVFLLVGYSEDEGIFHVLSSWGTGWGKGGFARLSYADAQQNLLDLWAVRTGV